MLIEIWRDEHGTEWDLVQLEGGAGCLIRECLSRTDWIDGDVREGADVIARFSDADDARAFLSSEGFGLCV